MGESTDEGGSAASEPAWQRRARLDRIFGDALPDSTRDDRDDGSEAGRGRDSNDARLRADVPPHHGS